MVPPPSSSDTQVSQQTPELISTVQLGDEETPIAKLAPHGRENVGKGKRRMAATKETRKDNQNSSANSAMSTGSTERLLKNVKQEK